MKPAAAALVASAADAAATLPPPDFLGEPRPPIPGGAATVEEEAAVFVVVASAALLPPFPFLGEGDERALMISIDVLRFQSAGDGAPAAVPEDGLAWRAKLPALLSGEADAERISAGAALPSPDAITAARNSGGPSIMLSAMTPAAAAAKSSPQP